MIEKWLVTMALLLGCSLSGISLPGRDFRYGYDRFRPYGFQPVGQWKKIRETYGREKAWQDSLQQALQKRKNAYLLCPWWLEDIYDDPVVAGCCRQGIGYIGYVLDPLTGKPVLTHEWNNDSAGLLNSRYYQRIPYDLVVYCRGGAAFDQFLHQEEARLNFLHQIFDWPDGMINRLHQGRRPRGIHFYLPDFSFREKRAFTQFIKSVSIIIDSMRLDDGRRPYEGNNCMLYVTLPTQAWEQVDFLSGIAVFVDEVRFVDYDRFGVPYQALRPLTVANDPTGLMTKLMNQFYLFRFKRYRLTGEADFTNIDYLAQADYDNFQWENYFLLEILLLLTFCLLLFLYHFYSPFYMLAERNRWLVVPVGITFVTEAVIVFLYVLEAISKDEILFGMDECQHLWLLALPLLFIFLYVMLKMWGENKQLP